MRPRHALTETMPLWPNQAGLHASNTGVSTVATGMRPATSTPLAWLALGLVVLAGSGCGLMVERATTRMADNLSAAILNQEDPEIVRDGAPAYLLLMDSLVEGNPESVGSLSGAASLYAAYGSVFVSEPARAKLLTERGFDYGRRAICADFQPACGWSDADFDSFYASLARVGRREVPALYAFSVSGLAYTRAHADDWGVLADLPKIEAALNRVYALDPSHEASSIELYLGILNSLRPPALGGKPEVGRAHFERAIELSGGRDLTVKVEFARTYARLIYDRELHDRLLEEVLAAEPQAPRLTLFNVLAQREARELLASADDYF
jgi:hypothetical protein